MFYSIFFSESIVMNPRKLNPTQNPFFVLFQWTNPPPPENFFIGRPLSSSCLELRQGLVKLISSKKIEDYPWINEISHSSIVIHNVDGYKDPPNEWTHPCMGPCIHEITFIRGWVRMHQISASIQFERFLWMDYPPLPAYVFFLKFSTTIHVLTT